MRRPRHRIGSKPESDVIIPDLLPAECRIYFSAQGYYAQDLSGNLSINGNPGSGYIRGGDVLELGTISVRVTELRSGE